MVTFVLGSDEVSVPDWVKDVESFRRWAESDEFPENGRVCFFNGGVWVDMSGEQVFSHVLVKTRIATALSTLAEDNQLGLFLVDGVLLSNFDAGFAVKPDAVFASAAALQDRVRLIEGKEGGYVELEGSPDMVLEVVSPGSVRKDTVDLKKAYWEAGVREYWLVDARKDPPRLDILRHTARGYVAARRQGGWVKSGVFGKSFRLVRRAAFGHPAYTLEVR